MPLSAMPAAHHGAMAAVDDERDHQHMSASADCEDAGGVAALGSCSGHTDMDGQGEKPCCGGIACHAVQISVPPTLNVRAPRAQAMTPRLQEQVASTLSGRIDRPPRTI
jgi:hypothetical protein